MTLSPETLKDWKREAEEYMKKFHYKNHEPGGSLSQTKTHVDRTFALISEMETLRAEALEAITFYEQNTNSLKNGGGLFLKWSLEDLQEDSGAKARAFLEKWGGE